MAEPQIHMKQARMSQKDREIKRQNLTLSSSGSIYAYEKNALMEISCFKAG